MQTLIEKHNLISETRFQLKSFLLIARRKAQNQFVDLKRFPKKEELLEHPLISSSETELWNINDNEQNWILTAGKIQNLRLAVKRIHGIEIPANNTFSFWRHIGNPNIGQGYVVGREIREGCIIPTIAGGLCQLSNALYDAALKADFEIIERHRHTKVIKGSLAEQDRDATVKWNYVDLRFRSNHAFRIEAELTSERLIIKFKSTSKNDLNNNDKPEIKLQSSKLNDCYSCGNFQCFKHPDKPTFKNVAKTTAFILDEKWTEYDDYLQANSTDLDYFIVPLLKNKFIKTARYNWTIKNSKHLKSTPIASIYRALKLRLINKSQNNVFSEALRLDKIVAKSAARIVPLESSHLVVSQNLLPFLWEEGIFGGRTFDVLMYRLPMEKLHKRLDYAHDKHPESKTLNDFRAPAKLIDLENIALTKARHIITPHREIADIFGNKSFKLNWYLPKPTIQTPESGTKVLFPGSALGRKGAYEMRRLAIELNLIIVITGMAIEQNGFWEGVRIETAGANPFQNIAMVVYPTYVEHQPRLLLKAMAAGIPIITTSASGLDANDNISVIPIGDYEALKETVTDFMSCKVLQHSL